jgi:H+/Cl- antiporter ClcA
MVVWRVFVAAFLLLWVGGVAGFAYWPAVRGHWPISLVMVLGSLVAGSTPIGGGAVAFPFLVLAWGESPTAARNFGLAIQALGMTSAMIFILCRRIPIQGRMLLWSAVGSALGVPLGTFLIAPYVADSIVKLLFSCLWMSFALLTLAKNREICSLERRWRIPPTSAIWAGLSAGLIGGVIASMIGVGVEMALYTVLVLLYRSDIKVAVPTAVCGMAIASLVGTGIHAALGDIQPAVFLNWLAAAPVVIFGAPAGAYLTTVISRGKVLYLVSALCVLQFAVTLKHVSPSGAQWLFVAAAMLVSATALYLLYRRGKTEAMGFPPARVWTFRGIASAVVLLGLLAGLAGTGFHFLADRFGQILFFWAQTRNAPARLPLLLLIPTAGLFLVGLVLQCFPRSARGGVREVAESLEQDGGVIPWHRVVNVILSGLVLAFGGSVGPEGPMVQMGALLGSRLGLRFGFENSLLKTMVRAGAAAGIAAAFRSPAGAVLLTVEVFGARFNRELVAIGVASAVGYLTRTALLADAYPFYFSASVQPMPLAGILIAAPLMGLLAGPAGHLFMRMLAFAKALFVARWPLALRVGLGGLLVGGLGVFYPQVLSAGYPVVEQALKTEFGVSLFVILLVLKMVATAITFGSGAVGGMFAPTLVMGAMFGGAFGFGLQRLYPAAVPQPEVFVLLGMVVMFGAIIKGYWSGLLLVADMSGCYHALLLPGVIAGGVAYLVSWTIHDRSVFDLPLQADQSPEMTPQTVPEAAWRVGRE